MGESLRVGVVGLGQISGVYLSTLRRLGGVQVSALADLDATRVTAALAQAPGAVAMTVDELLGSDDVDLVLNLTIPAAHAEIAAKALAAGKHVYAEKPLALATDDARALLAMANGLRIGCAPDTVLGTGTQTARSVVDSGGIGTPIAASAVFVCPGHEAWHPNPEFYYARGGGPLFDMGPYYLTSLIHMLGAVARVSGASSRSRSERTIASGPRAGSPFGVRVDTHVAGMLEHRSGVLTTIVMSFDVHASAMPRLEVHGTEASLSVPDPNIFGGDVAIQRVGEADWSAVPVAAGYAGAERGIGVADLAVNLDQGRPHRASADVALHVLDVMQTLLEAAAAGATLPVRTTCDRPEPVPLTQV